MQTEMMDKISDVQELKLVLHGLRRDNGDNLAEDLEQVTIELKLDEIVRQHVVQMKQTTSNGSTPTANTSTTTTATATGKRDLSALIRGQGEFLSLLLSVDV